MVELDQMKLELMQYKDTLKEVRDSLDIDNKKKRIEELDMEMASPDFWSDPERANKLSKDAKNMKDTVETCDA
ncbi:MAG: PCRF domain-containing protein, partial [Lachnospiraceae bacterium]|nr:PCRF domain-containing protein [Lachnospiraceae bacterium]